MNVPTTLKLADTIQVAILKMTTSRAFGASQAIGGERPTSEPVGYSQRSLPGQNNINSTSGTLRTPLGGLATTCYQVLVRLSYLETTPSLSSWNRKLP